MKKILSIFSTSIFISCSQQASKHDVNNSTNPTDSAIINQQYFGEKITADSAKPVSAFL